jgi:hypothetical protein
MGLRSWFAAAVIAPATVGVLLSTPFAGAADPSAPCRVSPCRAEMKVGPDELRWRSVETFYPANERLKAVLSARGRRLRLVERWGPERCRGAYRGSGIVAVVKACGPETPVRVRAYRLKRRAVKLVVAYRATPMISG